jgi:hypothetical protein
MHALAVLLFFSAAVMALGLSLETFIHLKGRHRYLTMTVMGIGLAWLAGFNMWAPWHISLRYDWVGITLTGAALGATAIAFHELIKAMGRYHKTEDYSPARSDPTGMFKRAA